MTPPAVSVVVATLGRAALVDGLLTSLAPALAAFPGETEVVLCDASTGVDAAAVALAATRHNARVVRAAPGIARQRNAGSRAARFPLVWFVDSDCVATPGSLQALVDGLGRSPDAAGAAGAVVLVGPRSSWLDAAVDTGVVASFDGFGASPDDPVPWGVTANLLLRRGALEQAGWFDESLPAGEDVDLGLRLHADVVWVPDAVVQHRTETWRRGADALARFLRYGAADAHLLRRHAELRGPVEPSVANALPLVAAGALLGTPTLRQAGAGLLAWAASSLVLLGALSRPRQPSRGLLAGVLAECLHIGRQLEALRRGDLSTAFCGVVLDPGQRERERARRRRTAAALALATVPAALASRP